MNVIPLLFFLTIAINDTSGIINDNQTNYTNGVIINQSQINDIQSDYNNGIIITKKSELLDSELVATPFPTLTTTSTPITTSVPISSSSSSGGGSSGGSGGGGITSSEDYKNILQFETHENTLLANQLVLYKFKLPIYEVLITGKENEYDVSVRVELLRDLPYKATIKPDGEVIQYFNVATSSKRLKEAIIRFKSNNSVNNLNILKLVNSTWKQMDYSFYKNVTIEGNNQPSYSYYEVKTDSLSNFAIVKNEQIPSAKLSDNKITPILTANLNDKDIPLIAKQSSGFDLVITIISFVGLIYKKKQEN